MTAILSRLWLRYSIYPNRLKNDVKTWQILDQDSGIFPLFSGYQRRPDGRVLDLSSMPTPEEFYNKFMLERKPVIFRKMVEDVPAAKLWDDNYLKKK